MLLVRVRMCMFIRVYVYVCICMCLHVCLFHTHSLSLSLSQCVRVYSWPSGIFTRSCEFVCVCAWYLCMYVCVCVCVCVRAPSFSHHTVPAIPSNAIHCTRAMPHTPFLCLWVLFDGPFSTIKYNFLSDPTVTAVASEQPPAIIRYSTKADTPLVAGKGPAVDADAAFAPVPAPAPAAASAAIASSAPTLLLQPSSSLLSCGNSDASHPGDASIRFGWFSCPAGVDTPRQDAPLLAFVVHGSVNFRFFSEDCDTDDQLAPPVNLKTGCMFRNPSPSTWTHVRAVAADDQPAQFFFVRRVSA
jgi:hypothetical protein